MGVQNPGVQNMGVQNMMGVQNPPLARLPQRLRRLALFSAGGLLLAAAATAATPPRSGQIVVPGITAQPGGSSAAPAQRASIDSRLLRQFGASGRQDYVIELRERADLSAAYAMDWQQRGRHVYRTLQDTAQRSQAALRRALAADGVQFEAHWIKNVIVVRNGDLASANKASRHSEVARIGLLPEARPIAPQLLRAAPGPRGIGDNIRQIGADQVWAQGTTGNGVTIGIVDSGVDYQHEALRAQYRGALPGGGYDHDYNWYDPMGGSPQPTATEPHGTHVAGTAVGDNRNADPALRERIGVAPGAQWTACQGFPMNGETGQALLACGEFMLAPTRRDGSAADPDRRPQVVNNSWSTGETCDGEPRPFFQDMVEAWAAAGVIPLFAQGNAANCDLPEPPGLSTVPSPASLAAAFAVGSTGDHDGEYAPHSVWGPTTAVSAGLPGLPDPRGFPQLKPQVVAPGVAIRSAYEGGYSMMTGTSMSTPHVAGLLALMIEAGDCLRGDYATLGTLLMQTARPLPYASGGVPAPGLGDVPNYATGWGEVDAPAAVDAAAAACGPQGFIEGHVRSAGGAPVGGATVDVFVAANQRIYQLVSDTDGRFIRRLPAQAGSGYTVRVAAYGYLPDSESGVLVSNGMTTTHDVTLATAPLHKISGVVTDATTGWPLHARLRITGYPGQPVWTDPLTGAYAIRLPTGTAYRFDVDSDIPGYRPASRDIADAAAAGSQDFTLDADPLACTAPGYAYATQLLGEDFQAGALPAGWTRSSAGVGWLFGNSGQLSSETYVIPAHGLFASSNESLGADAGWGNDGRYDYLGLPALNLAGVTAPVLRYASHFQSWSDSGGVVEGSRDGGASWIALGKPRRLEAFEPWSEEIVDLAPLAGVANARIRWHADDGSNEVDQNLGPAWGIDDVRVRGGCAAPLQTGLLVGHVRDANSGAALDGAEVRAGNNTLVHSFSSEDGGVGAGFYAAPASAGAVSLAASRGTLPAGYGDTSRSLSITAGVTQSADLALPAGRLRLYPSDGPAASVVLGTIGSAPFTVRNTGSAALSFGLEGVASEQHFDGDFPPPGWSVVNRGNPDCAWSLLAQNQGNYAGGDGQAATVQLYNCADTPGDVDSDLISAPLDLSRSHTASMGFFVSLFNSGMNNPEFDVDVSTDAGSSWNTIWTRSAELSPFGPGSLVELDLSAFAGHADVRVRLHSTATPPYGWVIVDQLHLFHAISEDPLLDLTPDYGSLAAGASQELSASFDARGIAQPGVYTVPVRVAEDTPYEWPFGDLYGRMTVTAPASYGAIAGSVQSLGACDISPVSLPGAQVTIRDAAGGQFTTLSDADGKYRYWLPAGSGPFTLEVQADAHLSAARSGLTLNAGAQTRADFGLRPLLPCLLSDRPALSAQVANGQSAQVNFQLMNGGAAATGWSLRSGGDPDFRQPLPLQQTVSPDPQSNYSTACFDPGTGNTLENHFLRVFRLDERDDPAQIATITGLSFAIDTAHSASGTQPLWARVYKLNGALEFANLQLLREKQLAIADGDLQRISVRFDEPLIVARDTVLVAAIYSPSGSGLGNSFFPGFNALGQSEPGYMASSACGQDQPTRFADIDPRLADLALLLELEVMSAEPCGGSATPAPWLAVNPATGSLAADASVAVQAQINATLATNGEQRGSLCLAADGDTRPRVIPVNLRVGSGDAIFADGFD
jgi:subtilisin family serine protease